MTDGTDRRTEFVLVAGNPAPKGAELIWFEGSGGRQLRACMAPALDVDNPRGTCNVYHGRSDFIEKDF